MGRLCTLFCLALVVLAVSAQKSSKKPSRKKPDKNNGKIVGGRDANISEFPYMASLRNRKGHFCGGSIISPEYILTAAHCTDDISPNGLEVWAGISNFQRELPAQRSKVRAIMNHPSYNPRITDNDIAIVRLAQPFTMTPTVRAIELDRQEMTPPDQLKIAGWGATQENGRVHSQLQAASVPGITRSQCRFLYRDFSQITSSMICAGHLSGGIDACQGDSGGPAVSTRTNRQVGVVSWGAGCARRNRPGVYANVANFIPWIRRTTGLNV